MTSGNRVEELEKTVAELEATVQGLTEELVEANDRIRQIEEALGGEEALEEVAESGAGEVEEADDFEPVIDHGADPEEVAQAAEAAAEGDKSDESDGGDEGELDDIIVA